mgnify:CR=1 FL=1
MPNYFTINGKAYPATETIDMKVGETLRAAQGKIEKGKPAVLPPDRGAWATWLHGGWDKAGALLAPYSSSLMRQLER